MKKSSRSSSPKNIDRYAADVARAKAMRKTANADQGKVTTSSVNQALEQLQQSERLEQEGKLKQALDTSERALGILIQYLRNDNKSNNNNHDNIPISKDVLRSTVELALSNAESIKQRLVTSPQQQTQQTQQPTRIPSRIASTFAKLTISKSKSTDSERSRVISPASTTSSTNTKSPTFRLSHDDALVQLVKTELYVDQSQLEAIQWKDIAGLAQAKQSLQEAAILPLLRPDLFTGLRRPQNILLYGPPGTGKTMLVKAVAKESQSILFVCTASSLTSKWHGEGEKLLKTLFHVARAAAPSILFVDEVDALLSARKSEGEHEASRRFKTEFMTQVDGIVVSSSSSNGTSRSSGANHHLLLIACTNCPWDLDAAVMRRFPRRIYIDLPDKETRKELVNQLLTGNSSSSSSSSSSSNKHSLTRKEISKIVKRLEGYSGSDISAIASEASFGPLRSLGSVQAIQSAKADTIRPISYADFEQAMNQSTKSTSLELLQKYDQWKLDQSG